MVELPKFLHPIARGAERLNRATLIGKRQKAAYRTLFYTDRRTAGAYQCGAYTCLLMLGSFMLLTIFTVFGMGMLLAYTELPENVAFVIWVVVTILLLIPMNYYVLNLTAGLFLSRLTSTEPNEPEWRKSLPPFEVEE